MLNHESANDQADRSKPESKPSATTEKLFSEGYAGLSQLAKVAKPAEGEPQGPKPYDGPYDPDAPPTRDGGKPGDGRTPPRPDTKEHDIQSTLDSALGQNLYAQNRPNESDQEFIDRRQRTQDAIQRGGSRGLDEATRNAEQFLDQTGRIRVREQGGPWLGNPTARPTDRNAPAGIYPQGRDMIIIPPNGRTW